MVSPKVFMFHDLAQFMSINLDYFEVGDLGSRPYDSRKRDGGCEGNAVLILRYLRALTIGRMYDHRGIRGASIFGAVKQFCLPIGVMAMCRNASLIANLIAISANLISAAVTGRHQ